MLVLSNIYYIHTLICNVSCCLDLSRLVGSPVTGVIEGKCEHGYFVSVRVGATNLRGIVYHLPGQDAKKKTSRHWHKKKLRKRDPAFPRPNRSGYNFFFAEQHARLKPLYPGKDREIGRMIGDLWNKLTDVEKAVRTNGLLDLHSLVGDFDCH